MTVLPYVIRHIVVANHHSVDLLSMSLGDEVQQV